MRGTAMRCNKHFEREGDGCWREPHYTRSKKGHLGQYEDWWYLIEEDDGNFYVEHEWDHVNVGTLAKNAGSKSYSVEEFLSGDHEPAAKAALLKSLEAK